MNTKCWEWAPVVIGYIVIEDSRIKYDEPIRF